MEVQENGSTTAAPSSVAQEGLLVLPTPAEYVVLSQSQTVEAQQQTVETQIPTSSLAAGPVNNNRAATGFSSLNVEAAAALNCLSSYNEIVGKLNRLWEDQMTVIRNVDDSHWKNPEFPLARIKKIMRMDEEVKMISSEVPLMLSKVVEIFVMELSLRAWLHTEESKRRTVQRSDIAMAITKQDMFDFLIDIVPREEIQLKSKTQSKQAENDQLQLLTPELLQLYLQHVSQQQTTTTTTTNLTTQQQQQTLAQLQQLQSAQQQKQQQAQQQIISQQQQQQQLVDTLVGDMDMDEASAKIFQDNVALLQQLQQLVQLQLQVQQLQDATSGTVSGSASGDGTQSRGTSISLPSSETITLPHSASHEILISSVLNQPQQVMESSTDSIHRVTINAADDMLSESELQSALSSLSGTGSRENIRPSSSLLSSLPPSSASSLLSSLPTSSSSSSLLSSLPTSSASSLLSSLPPSSLLSSLPTSTSSSLLSSLPTSSSSSFSLLSSLPTSSTSSSLLSSLPPSSTSSLLSSLPTSSASSLLSSLPPSSSFSLLSSLPPSSTSSSSSVHLRRKVTPVQMVIEPEFVETGALANSPSPSSLSHDLLDNTATDSATHQLLTSGRQQNVVTQSVSDPRIRRPTVQIPSTSVSLTVLNTLASLSDPLSIHQQASVPGEGGGGGVSSTIVSTAQLQQLRHQLEPQISTILSQTGAEGSDEPEQYVVQTTPLLELVNSAHTVTINPTSAAVSDGNHTSIVQPGAGIPVATSNHSSSTLTPINATLGSSGQGAAFLSNISTSNDSPMET